MKLLPLFILLGSLLFPADADHLLLTRVVTQPDAAESFSIYNPTDNSINLSNYYICDDENYYEIQTKADMSPSHFLYGFTARFPNINIEPKNTLIIGLNYKYDEFYGENTPADLVMYLDQVNSMIETEDKSFGRPFSDIDGDDNDYGIISADSCNTKEGIWYGNDDDLTAYCGDGIGCNGTEITYCNDENSSNCIEECDDINPIGKFDDGTEMLILFYWDGNSNNLIQDVDYFLWGDSLNSMDKSEVPGYQNDTSADDQLFFEEIAENYYAYSRIGTDEVDETQTGGNGITGHDETSENFRESWEVKEIFKMGCTDSDAPNFDVSAEIDDGSCFTPFTDIINGVYDCGIDSRNACEDGIPSSDAANANCQLLTIEGKIVNFGDYSYANGPYALVVEDEQGYRLELTIWPDTWDILLDENYSILTEPPFFDFVVKAYGNVFTYNGKRQVYVCGPTTIEITQTYNTSGVFIPSDTTKTTINPEPFIIIPTLGENLNFTYTFPENSRVIIRIYDLSGRFITSLEDKYFEEAGTVIRNNLEVNEYGDGINSSAWDGRDQLGQIIAPGTYIMHIEAMNPVTGETQTDAAPIVVGVKN